MISTAAEAVCALLSIDDITVAKPLEKFIKTPAPFGASAANT